MIQLEKSDIVNDEFVNNILDEIREVGLTNIDYTELTRWNNYLLKQFLIPKDIIIKGIENYKIYAFDMFYQIAIDKDAKYKQYKLKDLCKMINNGTLQVKGYPIFSTVENHIISNMEKYIINWVEK